MTQAAQTHGPSLASPSMQPKTPGIGTIDVSGLPTYAFGKRDPLFWGALTLVAIEGMSILLVYFSLLYVRQRVVGWPLAAPTPLGTWLSAGIVLTLSVSALPNWALSRAAQRGALRTMQVQMVLLSALGLLACVLRGFEFAALPFRWDANIYGSLFWAALVLNTVHLGGGALKTWSFSDCSSRDRFNRSISPI
ncbi:MAG TPA: hypothetical protein VFQ61_06960 [Polyangiaceae bacterium]|nr:hypothetical protein [Polyangiaceae bacterium]